jgi:S-DNA-T family DNA segregation ATPase FtsK/SpoIIIE
VTSGPIAALLLIGITPPAFVLWWLLHPVSFSPSAGRVLLGIWRSAWTYGVRWRAAMMLSGLGGRFDGGEFLPRVVRVRAGQYFDRVRVRIVAGQQPEDWARRAEALAHAFGARSCQVTTLAGRPGQVELAIGRRDPLARVVPALPVPTMVDPAAVPVGITEAGDPWRLSVAGGAHTLLVGCTGSGKGSVAWSLLRGLAPAIRDGWVQVWGVDPKGGMELAPGARLFTRLAWEPTEMVELLEAAAALMLARSDHLRGRARVHIPTPEAPAVVVVVDELAKLTAYEPETALRRRATQALSVLLTQGRAPAITVVAALQDSRKDVVGFRSLFPVRVALRLVEADETRQVLGPGAHDRGARCERIPATLPGVGYVLLDGDTIPTRVRASWVSDDDIAATAADYAAPEEHGQVVVLDPDAVDGPGLAAVESAR